MKTGGEVREGATTHRSSSGVWLTMRMGKKGGGGELMQERSLGTNSPAAHGRKRRERSGRMGTLLSGGIPSFLRRLVLRPDSIKKEGLTGGQRDRKREGGRQKVPFLVPLSSYSRHYSLRSPPRVCKGEGIAEKDRGKTQSLSPPSPRYLVSSCLVFKGFSSLRLFFCALHTVFFAVESFHFLSLR